MLVINKFVPAGKSTYADREFGLHPYGCDYAENKKPFEHLAKK